MSVGGGECSMMEETKILVEITFISGLGWVVLGESHGFPWDGDQAVSVRILPGEEVPGTVIRSEV